MTMILPLYLFSTCPLEKLGGEGQLFPDQEIDFAFTISNEGNRNATNIEITEFVPCGYEFIPDLNAANELWTEDPITGNVTFVYTDVLLPGSIDILALTLVVTRCDDPDAYLNVVEITDAESTDEEDPDDQDSTPDNGDPNEDDQDSTEGGIVDLSLTKSFSTQPASTAIGSTLEYTITVTNEGSLDMTNVTIVDYLPCGLDFNSSAGWSQVGQELFFDIPGDNIGW